VRIHPQGVSNPAIGGTTKKGYTYIK